MGLIGLSLIHEIVETVLWTGWVEGEKPVSAILIADPESGKTEILEDFRYNRGVLYMSDVTVWGLTEKIKTVFNDKKPLNHLIIPDFLNPLSRQPNVSRPLRQFLNSVIEEGIAPIRTGFIDLNLDVQFGLLTAITRQKFVMLKNLWKDVGFLSRLLPISYKYPVSLISKILRSVFDEAIYDERRLSLNFPETKMSVQVKRVYGDDLIPIAASLAKLEGMQGIRMTKMFKTLLKAIALKSGRVEVSEEDVTKLKSMCNYVNYNFPFVESNDLPLIQRGGT